LRSLEQQRSPRQAVRVIGRRDGGSDGVVAHDSGSSHDAGLLSPPDAATDTTPYYNSDGWVGLQGFDRACGIYVAPSPTAKNFPSRLTWEPCDARVTGMDGGSLACRQIVGGTAYVASAFVNRASQSVTLPILRARGSQSLNFVADADGAVRQAFVTQPPLCGTDAFASVSSTSIIYTLEELSSDQSHVVRDGALGGPLDAMPKMLRVNADPGTVGYVAGANEFVESGAIGFDTASWLDGHRLDSISSSGTGQSGEYLFQGDIFFFSVDDLNYGRIELYRSGVGTIDFISFGDDLNNYAADLGTDGTDMVWTEASGHPGGGTNPWTTINIMTASYTTNPAAILKHRLRSEVRNLGDVPFTVGCGYAAHEISTPAGTGVRVVRISDGQSWSLFNTTSPLLTWNAAVAITCTEIFVNFNFAAASSNLARIRLDSLGPGTPAD